MPVKYEGRAGVRGQKTNADAAPLTTFIIDNLRGNGKTNPVESGKIRFQTNNNPEGDSFESKYDA